MPRKGCFIVAAFCVALAVAVLGFGWNWWVSSGVERDTAFVVPAGSSLTSVAGKLEDEGLIGSSDTFLLHAKLFGSGDPIRAGEFLLPAGSSASTILDTLQHGEAIRRFVTISRACPRSWSTSD